MLPFILIVTLFCGFSESGWIVNPGPKYPPTKGEVWPKPQVENKGQKYFTFGFEGFKFKVTEKTCPLLEKAFDRYVNALVTNHAIIRKSRKHLPVSSERHLPHSTLPPKALDPHYKGTIKILEVTLTQPCEEYPYFEMDESYNLTIASSSELRSDSLWGIMRGLETFAQSFYITDDYNEMRVNYTQIIDYPRYAHRGLLLDTSRHFITVKNIKTTLDAMAMNKMNVFHWHIVDDPSFPYQSEKFPNLSAKGAFHPSMVYTKDDIKSIVNYALGLGIRVLPEFDVPGHTRSWGEAFPRLLTECYDGLKISGLGPMDPLKNSTYKLLKELFQEVQEWFPDKYFHIGGDEVNLDCWESNPEILTYMETHNMDSVTKVHALFMERAIPLLANDTTPIVWQEVFDENVPLTKKTLVQVWKWGSIAEMTKVLKAGYKVLFSASWYLDHLKTGGDWEDMYNADPRAMVNNRTLEAGVVGGEACMWGEVVDDSNVISRVWPRTSAVAERLWSSPSNTPNTGDSKDVRNRLEEHTCRMMRRKVPAQPPNAAGFCVIS